MINNFKIKDNTATITYSSKVYPISAIKKALCYFIEDNKILITEENDCYIVNVEFKEKVTDEDIKQINNEVLRESVRYDVSIETKNIREIILARALHNECIVNDEKEDELPSYNVDEIAKSWFDSNE